LAEFEINEKQVEETVDNAESHLRRIETEDKSLKRIQFNNKIAEFKKCQIKHDRSLLGTLNYMPVNFEIDNLKQLTLSTEILKKYYSSINIFNHDDGINYAFYLNSSHVLNMICFDNDRKVIRENVNALTYNYGNETYSQLKHFFVANSFDGFVIYVKSYVSALSIKSTAICGHTVKSAAKIGYLLIKINRNFAYLSHKVNPFEDTNLLHMATNSSNILCVDSTYKYYYLDMNLTVISKPLDAITAQVGSSIVDVQINDQFAFFLCSTKKMKIFEIQTGNFIKEIESSANQIKLAPTEYLVLFDSINRTVNLYEQFGEFRFLDEFELAKSLNTGLFINHDKSKMLAFYNSECMNYIYLD
jgi:hypothetical protein